MLGAPVRGRPRAQTRSFNLLVLADSAAQPRPGVAYGRARRIPASSHLPGPSPPVRAARSAPIPVLPALRVLLLLLSTPSTGPAGDMDRQSARLSVIRTPLPGP
ncbi:hypothetical protein AURDEDRAFT_178366 [Auricularia subglabra TFB-10046 SS5]|uniref:Uncharacterized protein n=1 Tax=Auricularia subglabra (strain TFB-10046 / SS5) TaxID=717982 RepID=J0L8A1_AURST|nr:hypothetical protein AURDEDRAFT_178366 [Auricularia subglabra TFB-10046 SS5]